MAAHTLMSALRALIPAVPDTTDDQARDLCRFDKNWVNDTAQTGTNALAETGLYTVKRKCRLVAAKLVPDAAITGTATDYFVVTISKRATAAPGTRKQLCVFSADTVTTDDIAAFAAKDIYLYQDGITPATADFDFAVGDVVTVQVTKAGAGMTFPRGSICVTFEPRD